MRRHRVLSLLAAASVAVGVPSLTPDPAVASRLVDEARPASPSTPPPGSPDMAGIGAWFLPTDAAGPGAARFTAELAGARVDVRPGGLRLDLPGAVPATVGVTFVGGAADVVEGARPLPTRVSYLLGNDPARWRRSLPTYGTVRYRDVWPGVDLDYDIAGGRLKGTWTLQPGVPVSQVRWRYNSATAALADGQLVVTPTVPGAATITEAAPIAWQDGPAGREPVPCAYALDGGTVGFTCGGYDASRPLVIDPEVDWTAETDGSCEFYGSTVAVAADDSVVAGGQRRCTPAEFTMDGWIGRWTDDGELRWLVYRGGEDASDVVEEVAVRADGAVGYALTSASASFTTGSPDPGRDPVNPDFEAVAGVLDPEGAPVWTTAVVSKSRDSAAALAFTSDGGLVIGGRASPTVYNLSPYHVAAASNRVTAMRP